MPVKYIVMNATRAMRWFLMNKDGFKVANLRYQVGQTANVVKCKYRNLHQKKNQSMDLLVCCHGCLLY